MGLDVNILKYIRIKKIFIFLCTPVHWRRVVVVVYQNNYDARIKTSFQKNRIDFLPNI